MSTEAEIQLSVKTFPDSSVSSLIRSWLFTMGQTFNPSLAWKQADVFKINGNDDDWPLILFSDSIFHWLNRDDFLNFVAAVEEIFKIGSMAPGSLLYEASREYQVSSI